MRKVSALGEFKVLILVFLLCLTAATPGIYMGITQYDISDPAISDVVQYTKMYKGVALEEIPKPYRYRVVTPYLARAIPFLPESITSYYDVDPEKVLKFRFGVVNLFALAATGSLLFAFCRYMRFAYTESLLASYLFLTSFFVVVGGGIPLVDPLAFMFFMLGVMATLNNWYLTLFVSFTLGMFAKETTVLVIPSILLLQGSFNAKFVKSALCLPGLVGYLVFRWIVFPTNAGYDYSISAALDNLKAVLTPGELWVRIIVEGGFAFGVLWFLALHGWLIAKRDRDAPLFRLSFLVPLILITPFIIGSNVGRIWFLAFPVVIPLSVLSLRHVLGHRRPAPETD